MTSRTRIFLVGWLHGPESVTVIFQHDAKIAVPSAACGDWQQSFVWESWA